MFIDRERLTRLPETVSELGEALRDGLAIGAKPGGRHLVRHLRRPVPPGAVPGRPGRRRAGPSGGAALPRGHGTTARPAAFVGAEDLVTAMRRVLRLRGLVVEVHVLPEIAPGRADNRRDLALIAEADVAADAAGLPAHHAGAGAGDVRRTRVGPTLGWSPLNAVLAAFTLFGALVLSRAASHS